MDHNSGKIFKLEDIGMTESEARDAGLVPIPISAEEKVRRMNRHERRKWAAEQRREVRREKA